jgi:hypothetical protein
MQEFKPLRDVPSKVSFTNKDVLVVFGEVFARGYVNGLIDEAKKAGMKVIFSTVGRRDENDNLRALNADEVAQKDQPLINVPLECGFDLVKSSKGLTPVDQVKGLKLSEWNQAKIDWAQVEESRKKGRDDFKTRVKQYLKELEPMIPAGANVMFAHTMAGGVPRAKIIMPVMNRVFKGHGDRFTSSKEFWDGELGRLADQSFMDVTANSFADLIELSAPLRDKIEKGGGKSSYVAFGYHGTEILIGGQYKWQSYSPYLQGFAKCELERIAVKAMKGGVKASVYNAPEILTNSSSIFLGVEVALYPLLGAFKKEAPDHPITKKLFQDCEALLKPEHNAEEILQLTSKYFSSDIIQKKWSDYPNWPQHNGPEQMALMQNASSTILNMHKDDRHLLTATLSEVVFKACGRAMITEGASPRESVWWIGHDLVAKLTLAGN